MDHQKETSQKLTAGTFFSYGIGAVGEGIGYNVFFSFFTFFLTTQAGIEPAIAGIISGVAVLWDAITDPIIGNWSDRTKNKRGRRRPFIMAGSVLFGATIALLFMNFNIPHTAKVIYYVVVNMVYWLALTTCVIPHISLGSELSEDYDERTRLRTFAATLMAIGTLIAVGTPLLLVEAYTRLTGSADKGWALAGVTYGVLTALVYEICCILLKGKEPANPNLADTAEQKSTGETFRVFLRNAGKAFRNRSLSRLIGITFFVNIVVTLGSGLAIYLLTYVYRYDEAGSSLIYTLQGIFAIIATVLMGTLAGKLGKKSVMITGIIAYIAAYLIIIIFPISFATILASIIVYALGNAGYWAMIYAMSYDASIVEQLRTGDRPDGLYTSLIGLFMKFGNALGSVIVGVGLSVIGFSETVKEQTEAVVHGIRYFYALAPAAVLVFALLFAIGYPLTRKRYELLSDALEKKQSGREWNESLLRKM